MASADRLGIGIYPPTWAVPPDRAAGWDEIQELIHRAEAMDVDAIWIPDMFGYDFWDAWSLVAAVAATTKRVRIGTLVLQASLRQPALVARMASTVDEISGGRLILGLGAGGPDRVAQVLDLPVNRQYGRFEEALRITRTLLRERSIDFRGAYFQARDATLGPKREGSAGPPIWVAAAGPKMMRLTAQWADGINFSYPPTIYIKTPEEARDLNGRLDQICREVGRSPETLTRMGNALISFAPPDADQSGLRSHALTGTPREIAEGLHALHLAGIEHLWCAIDAPEGSGPMEAYPLTSMAGLQALAPVIVELRRLESSPATPTDSE